MTLFYQACIKSGPWNLLTFVVGLSSLFGVLIYLLLELISSSVFCSAGGEGTAVFLALIFIGIFAQQGGGHCCSAGVNFHWYLLLSRGSGHCSVPNANFRWYLLLILSHSSPFSSFCFLKIVALAISFALTSIFNYIVYLIQFWQFTL